MADCCRRRLSIFIFKPKTFRRRALLDPRATICTNMVESHKANLKTKFQASKPSCSEEEDFLNIFSHVFLRIKPRTPGEGAILDPGATI